MLDKHLVVKTAPTALPENLVKFGDYRITVLDSGLFRVEKSANGKFNDNATLSVWYRNAAPQKFTVTASDTSVTITTDRASLTVCAQFKDSYAVVGGVKTALDNKGNLKGTYRTLDGCDGNFWDDKHIIEPENGIISRTGVAVLDDTGNLTLGADGKTHTAADEQSDLYVFAYGTDYRAALRAFYGITGNVPMIPRFALGNWWSRYHVYTDREYLNLLDKFNERGIPLSVATIDMDWHYSEQVDKQKGITASGRDTEYYGGIIGWTGYSWNRELFPDYRVFLKEIKRRGIKITLNLHPADGVRWFEDIYPEFAREMGIDPETGKQISFDLSDDNFINNYFKLLHKPYERDGVDFWWIDWQQGINSTVPGLDPLWALNHYHYLDIGVKNSPLILSRYCKPGSHRYPLGFSGDTAMSWKTLDYLPYFTATATNIGYSWWSHDIGGHHKGIKDNALYVRFLQFGVLSPINRLHCTQTESVTKEPWAYAGGTQYLAEEWLKFRHKLIPYIYTASYINHTEGRALIEPLYYEYQAEENAYKYTNEYFYGSELLVVPVTTPCDGNGISETPAWLPDGRWTDVFSGDEYIGDRELTLYRTLDRYPVFARSGAVFVLADDLSNSAELPEHLTVSVFKGEGEYTLYEDANDKKAFTKIKHGGKAGTHTVEIFVTGDECVIPVSRVIRLKFINMYGHDFTVTADGAPVTAVIGNGEEGQAEFVFDSAKKYVITLKYSVESEVERLKRQAFGALLRCEGDIKERDDLDKAIKAATTAEEVKKAVNGFNAVTVDMRTIKEAVGI